MKQPNFHEVLQKYAVGVTPHVQKIIEENPDSPFKKQFIPDVAELDYQHLELSDPIGDEAHSQVNGIIHRYPDRCLLTPVRVCPVYCRFCFRKENIGPGNPALTPAELRKCFDYIREHKEIWEVILSGGDPLILRPKQLRNIIEQLASIEHVQIIRIHTRVPALDPDRITDELVNALKLFRPIYVLLHANHPLEFSPEACAAISKLVDNGIVMLGQTVLLKGINDNEQVLSELFKRMIKNRIKPYYLHHADLTRGTSHFRTTIEHGQNLIAKLRGKYSGLCQPEYVLDIPGGHGKTPISLAPRMIEEHNGTNILTNFKQEKFIYPK